MGFDFCGLATVHMLDGDPIAFAETVAIGVPIGRRDEVRVAEFIAVVWIGPTMVVEVFAGSVNAVAVATLLGFGKLPGWGFPTSTALIVLWWRRALIVLRGSNAGEHREREKRGHSVCEFHCVPFPKTCDVPYIFRDTLPLCELL
jgi:hypothetical protein